MQLTEHIYHPLAENTIAGPPLELQPGRAQLERWVRQHGSNSTSYVLLEGPKRYFTSPRVDGFIAYQVRAGVPVIGGDPVCEPDRAHALLTEFERAMHGRPICAYQVSPELLKAYRCAGFEDVQIGNEAVFDLTRFTLAGGQMELVRAATNKARREGVVILEHHPFALGAAEVNKELRSVSEEWLHAKGNHEMGFLLGSFDFSRRSAKRYFVARSGGGKGRIEGFIVCEPIYGRNGYYLDCTRRRIDAIRGTMELLTSEIFRVLGDEGCDMASMGLAPLAKLDDPDLGRHPRLTKLMKFAYESIEGAYDFKQLYRYKAKYHPHAWERRYLCFNQPTLSPRMLYAIVQVRNAISLRDILRREMSGGPQGNPGFELLTRVESWKHAASFAIGLGSALLLS